MSILDRINDILNFSINTPRVPPVAILAARNRPGLSALKLANAILTRKEEYKGSDEPEDAFVRVVSEEIIDHFLENAAITVAAAPGTIITTANGVAADGTPVTTVGRSTNIFGLDGIIR